MLEDIAGVADVAQLISDYRKNISENQNLILDDRANRIHIRGCLRRGGAQIGDLSVCDRSQLPARIHVRGSTEFYDTLKRSAKRAQLSVSDYTRLAIAERMALDELGIAVLNNEMRTRDGR